MTPGRRRASVVVVGIEGRVGRRRVVVVAWTLWGSVCALSLLLIVLTIAFHLVTRYDWYFGDSFHPWRTQTVGALGTLGAQSWVLSSSGANRPTDTAGSGACSL